MSIGLSLCLPVTSVSSGATIVEILELSKPRSLMTVPSVLEDIAFLDHDVGIRALRALRFVAFGGGPLKSSVGEKLAASGVVLLNHYGATETGALAPIFAPVPNSNYDYRYFRLRKDFDLQVVPIESPPGAEMQYKLVAHPFGWDAAFEVQDQLTCSPDNPDSDFNAIGRNDDLIVLASGEKVVPKVLEVLLSESEHCKVAIAFGQNQFELGVLIEPMENVDRQHQDSFKNKIWPTVQHANERMDAHARISSTKAIVIVPAGKSIPRTDKGSIMRKEVYNSFGEEISQAYSDLEHSIIDSSLAPLDTNQMEASIKELITDRLSWKIPPHKWTYEHDLFELGMDSLQALQLRRLLLALVHMSKKSSSRLLVQAESISRDFVYRNPSVSKLAAALQGNNSTEHEDMIDRFVDLYAIRSQDPGPVTPDEGSTILLTGSTGSLGLHVLAYLANTPSVAQIICLNRASLNSDLNHPERRVKRAAEAKGISISELAWSKIKIIQTDTATPHLGLPKGEYDEICGLVTHVLHMAWPMDFNRLLPSFEAQFQGLRNLLGLCRDVHTCRPLVRPKFVFVSSIAVVGKYPEVHGERIVPEIIMSENDCTDDFGYAQAKLVCERIIERAALAYRSEFHANVVRVGQMTGAKMTGLWNVSEHFPALVKSSQLISSLPKLYGTLSWIPVDYAAQVLVELVFASSSKQFIFHLENPIRQSWHEVLTTIASELKIAETSFLPYGEWLARVLAVPDDRIDKNPAKNLAVFFAKDFEHMASGEIVMDTGKAREVSGCLRGTNAIDKDLIAAYVARWHEAGFLN
jgi:thioester reductase-like protein